MDDDEDEFPAKTPQEQMEQAHQTALFALQKRGNVQGALVHLLGRHYYDTRQRGSERPDDPGWNVCRCGTWQGYWSGYDYHVAGDITQLLIEAGLVPTDTPIKDL